MNNGIIVFSPSLSTDKLAALVELSRHGSLRGAAAALEMSEQGVRSRLLALEAELGVELYRKKRGVRQRTPLTERGQRLLPHAVAFLEQARDLVGLFRETTEPTDIYVAASQYLTAYVLIDAVRRFHKRFPDIRIRLSTRSEREIEEALLDNAVTIGIAAPHEFPSELRYAHLFSMRWSLIAPKRHPLLRRQRILLRHLADVPLILFESGSTGRQHVLEAFQRRGLAPRVEMDVTSTQIIVRMVEAGLGVSIVPLLPSGAVTRGMKVGARSLGRQIRPIHSGILTRRDEELTPAARSFCEFLGRSKS